MNLRPFIVPCLLTLTATAACTAPDEGEQAVVPPAAQAPQSSLSTCPTRTAIWQNPGRSDPCPTVKDGNNDGNVWVGAPTFNAGEPNSTLYCKYIWNSVTADPDFLELQKGLNPDSVPALEPELDCPVVGVLFTPEAPSQVTDVWRPLRDRAFQLAGSSPAPLPKPAAKLRVAVIDTSKALYEDMTPPAYGDADEHGRLVGRVIGDLACPDALSPPTAEGCTAEIRNYPALARKDGRSVPDWAQGPPDGGYYGSLSELAEAIERALFDWNQDRVRQDGPPRLVINLSVGWARAFGGDPLPGQPVDLNKVPKPARPVYEALARASCAGAVVIAAAGNYDLSKGEGMVYPAAWEAAPAPDQSACADHYPLPPPKELPPLAVFPPREEGAYRPLVYAVGALDALDQPAGIGRLHGMPRLAAYGVGVATSEPRTGLATRIKTGTSLSAAITSGAAALAWSYKPELRPDEIMQIVYESGVSLGTPADVAPDVCAGGPCSAFKVHRVSACSAAATVLCHGLKCEEFPCDIVPPFGGEPARPLVDWASVGLPPDAVSTPGACPGGPDACTWQGDTNQPEPWVGPQPGGGGCDTCVYSDSEGKIVMALDKYAQSCAYAVTAEVETASGTEAYTVTPPVASVTASPSALTPAVAPAPQPPFQKGIFVLPLPHHPGEVRSVTLWFHTDDANHEGGSYTRTEGIAVVR